MPLRKRDDLGSAGLRSSLRISVVVVLASLNSIVCIEFISVVVIYYACVSEFDDDVCTGSATGAFWY